MRKWLVVGGVAPLAAAAAAHAQMNGLAPADVASVARTRALDLRLSQQQGYQRPLPLIGGMIAPAGCRAQCARLGSGLANHLRPQEKARRCAARRSACPLAQAGRDIRPQILEQRREQVRIARGVRRLAAAMRNVLSMLRTSAGWRTSGGWTPIRKHVERRIGGAARRRRATRRGAAACGWPR